jgi:hypothetical protein
LPGFRQRPHTNCHAMQPSPSLFVRRLAVWATSGVQAAVASFRLRLTLRSRGGPTAGHQAWATVCSCPFSVAQAWRPTVGLPLTSHVRRRGTGTEKLIYTARPSGLALVNAMHVAGNRSPNPTQGQLTHFLGPAFRRANHHRKKMLHWSSPAAARRLRAPGSACVVHASRHLRVPPPNPSVKRSANGRPPGPGRWYPVHFHRPGPGVLPLSPAYLKR